MTLAPELRRRPTGTAGSPTRPPTTRPAGPDVEIVVPVHNEQADLAASVRRLLDHLEDGFPFTYRVTIADNASTDDTWAIASTLAQHQPHVRAVRLDLKGRGRALHTVWSASDATVLAYMDVDLSTDLSGLLPLVAPLMSGHSDVAIGSRLARSARVVRGPKRELISRGYNVILHAALGTRFSDAQCGFKAIRADRARVLLPLVEDTGWFFDTELLVLAERSGMRIHEVPVDWIDDADSRVDIVATAKADLRGVARLARGLASGSIPLAAVRAQVGAASEPYAPDFARQVLRFVAVGVVSTIAFVALYVAFRTALPAQVANALALLMTAVGNTAANRRYTFGVRGRRDALTHQLQGLAVFALALGVTGGALAALHRLDPDAPRALEVAVLVGANLVATVLRFVLLRVWVFRSRRGGPPFEPSPADGSTATDSVADPPIAGLAALSDLDVPDPSGGTTDPTSTDPDAPARSTR